MSESHTCPSCGHTFRASERLQMESEKAAIARGYSFASSEYDIQIYPPGRWRRWKNKAMRTMPHWFNWLTNPTYRMLWQMMKAHK